MNNSNNLIGLYNINVLNNLNIDDNINTNNFIKNELIIKNNDNIFKQFEIGRNRNGMSHTCFCFIKHPCFE